MPILFRTALPTSQPDRSPLSHHAPFCSSPGRGGRRRRWPSFYPSYWSAEVWLTVSVQVAAIKAPIEGYTVVDMQWEIEVFPGRVEILNGTIQEAYRQAKEMNPEFDPELPLPEASRALEARGLQRRSTVKCGGWPTGYFQTLYRVIQLDIRPRKGIARNPPGPGACSRPGCDRSGTVWWCNDVSSTHLRSTRWTSSPLCHVENHGAVICERILLT